MSDDDRSLQDEDAADSSAEVEVAMLLEGYLSDLEAGRPADPDHLIAANPHLAGPLRACLEVMGQPLGEPGKPGAVGPVKNPRNGTAVRPGPNLSTFYWGSEDGLPRVQLSEPGGDELAPVLSRPGLPVQAGRYQILGEIARGGMGAVLRARDADLGRELALKILLRPHRDDTDLRNRFVEEAQIGGQLQHPGIVPVYELGAFPDRRPFLAMKLVRGRTLSALLAERPDPTHDLSRFLAIFEQVCQTVAYAHSRRVIHRDLKPSNVMVGSFGEVQVMDWGLAKVLPEGGVADERKRPDGVEAVTEVRTLRTEGSGSESQVGSVLGTPAYMAPEQARGEIDRVDERADAFGLGAILCEILTGRPPYMGFSRGEIQAQAARADLADAQTRLDACGAVEELSRLARDCMAARPSDRPRDAGTVARRVTAYTTGAQERLRAAELAKVEAQARASEERKRRRLAVGLAAALIGLMVTLGGGGAWWAYDRQARAGRVDMALHGVEVLFGEAEREGDDLSKWSAAREAANQLSSLVAEARDEATRARVASLIKAVEHGSVEATADRVMLDELVATRSDSGEESPDQTDDRYAEAFRDRGIDPDILLPADAGRAIASRPPRVALAMAFALDGWGSKRRVRGDRAGAARVDAVARLADPDPWRSRLRAAWAEPDPAVRREALLRLASETNENFPPASITLLGALLVASDEAAAAEAVLRPSRDREPGDVWLNLFLGRSLKRLGRSEEAIRYLTAAQAAMPEAAHELAHALADKGERDAAISVFRDLARRRPDLPFHYNCLGRALESQGRAREAKEAFDAAIAASRRRLLLKPGYAPDHITLGTALHSKGEIDAAIAEYREAIRLKPDYAVAHLNLGFSLRAKGKVDAAIAEFREAIRLKPDYAKAHVNLGAALNDTGEVEAAMAEYRQAIRLKPDDVEAHNNLGNVLKAKGKVDAAIAEYREAIRLQPDLGEAHLNLGTALKAKGDVDGAIAEFREAIRLKPDLAEAYYSLGNALHSKGEDAATIAEYREAIRLKPNFAGAHENLGHALRAKGEVDAAIAEFREAIRLKPDLPTVHLSLGAALGAKGDVDAAIAEYREAIRLNPGYAEAHDNLGLALHLKGDVDGAINAWHRAHDLAASNPGLLRRVESMLAGAERTKRMAERLPAVLRGDDQPGDVNEQLAFAMMCLAKKLDAAAARLFADAFSANPAIADNRQVQHRYNAACAAALAGCGKGEDVPAPDEADRVKLRQQALDWLKAELVVWTNVLDRDAKATAFVVQRLRHWKTDADLAGVRDADELAKLPEAERASWRALWEDVDRLLTRAGSR
jgi:eukaryotic-like serine/threonine-protein kinase